MEYRSSIPIFTVLLALVFGVIHAMQWSGTVDTVTYALYIGDVSLQAFIIHPYLHGNPYHLLSAIAFLGVFCWYLEGRMGVPYAALAWILGTVSGALAWLLFAPVTSDPLIGSTGGITCMAIAYLVLGDNRSFALGPVLLWGIALLFFVPVQGFATTPWIVVVVSAIVGMLYGIFSMFLLYGREEEVELLKSKFASGEAQSAENDDQRIMARLSEAVAASNSNGSQASIVIEEDSQELSGNRNRDVNDLTTSDLMMEGEAVLLSLLDSNPENVEARCQLVELYINKKKKQDAEIEGRSLIKLLIDQGVNSRAYKYYRAIVDQFGDMEISANLIGGLLKNRLTAGDIDPSEELLEKLMRVEPSNRLIPDYLAQYVRLLARSNGPNDRHTVTWLKRLTDEYPAHPSTQKLLGELNTGEIETVNGDNGKDSSSPLSLQDSGVFSIDHVRKAIKQKHLEEAVDILIDQTEMVRQFDPLILYGVTLDLLQKPETISKGVVLLELTIRAHIKHPNTPNLIVELVSVYISNLKKPERARQWYQFLSKRWPNSPATMRAKELTRV